MDERQILLTRIEALEKHKRLQTEDVMELGSQLGQAWVRIETLRSENFRLQMALSKAREVLEAFADQRNWQYQGRFDPNSSNFNGLTTAQEVLAALNKDVGNG